MEDRKNLFVVIFITFFVMAYVQWMFPQQPLPPPAQTAISQQLTNAAPASDPSQPSLTVPNQPITAASPIGIAPAASATRPSIAQLKENPVSVVDTGIAIIEINHLGARIQSIKLKAYTNKLNDSHPYEMISHTNGAPLPGALYVENGNDDFVLYTLDIEKSGNLNGSMYEVTGNGLTLTFRGTLTSGNVVQKQFVFIPGSYDFSIDCSLERPSSDGQPAWLEWNYAYSPLMATEDSSNIKRISFLNTDKKLTDTHFTTMNVGVIENKNGIWAGIADYYFLESIINPGGYFRSGKEGDVYFVRSAGTETGGKFKIYAGPKDIEVLKGVGASLERSVDLGIFSFLAHPILWLMKFFYSFIGNYGLSIILLTLLIKLAFLPLTQASFKSMQAMQDLQPEMKALRERIEDPNVLNQEIMALYKKRGVNPLGGCFPVLIQIPVFLGLYNALLNSIDLRHKPFALWLNDLSAPENFEIWGINIPIMILLMGISMVWQQKMQPSTLDPAQQKVMMFMPIIFTGLFILHPMPSGLVLYWLINNIMSIVQQLYIKGHKNGSPLVATAYASLAILTLGFALTWIS